MRVRPARVAALAAVAGLALSGALALETGPAGATTPVPPWQQSGQSDPNEVGTLSLFDATGAPVTSGSINDAPIVAYAVGSTVLRAGDTHATLYGALPSSGKPQGGWTVTQLSGSPTYPPTGAPASVSTTAPVWTGTNADSTIADLIAQTPNTDTSNDGYAGLYELRIKTTASGVPPTATYDAADILVSGSSWQLVYPQTAGPTGTTTTLSASPNPAVSGAAVTLTATESPAASGSVQFMDGATDIGTPVEVDANGKATTTTSTLAVGAHSLTAVFTPADTTMFNPSTSAVVTETIIAHATSVSIAGGRTVNYGTSVSITGTLKDTSTNVALAGQAVLLQQRVTTSSTWTTLGTYHSSSTGALAASVKPGANVYYRWYFNGSSAYKGSISASATVNVNWVLTGAVNHASIKSGQTVLFWGSVSPIKTGTKVILQQLNGKTYGNTAYYGLVKYQKLPNGKTGYGYIISVRISSKKTYNFRATVAATSALHQGYSTAHLAKVS